MVKYVLNCTNRIKDKVVKDCFVSKSLLSSVDKYIRLRTLIERRLDGLQLQFKLQGEKPCHLVDYLRDKEILDGMLDVLLYNSVISNSPNVGVYRELLTKWKAFPSSLELHCILLFGSYVKRPKFDRESYIERHPELDPEVLRYNFDCIDQVMEVSRKNMCLGRRAELLRRFEIELSQRYEEGWYFVFNTLTVDSRFVDEVFSQSSKGWSKYIGSIDRLIGIQLYGSWRKALYARRQGKDFHRYFAVVEKGSLSGRLHLHVLHMFACLPVGCCDPNVGCVFPVRREIQFLKKFWEYGFSSPIAVRFSMDAYARIGWRWPVKGLEVDGRLKYVPLEVSSLSKMCNYIGKYISKDIEEKEPGCIWRTRMSRRMGQEPLKKKLMTLSQRQLLEMLKVRSMRKLYVKSVLVPRLMMKRLVLRLLDKNILIAIYRRVVRSVPVKIFAHLGALIAGKRILHPLNFGVIRIRKSIMEVVFKLFCFESNGYGIMGVTYAV